MTTSASFSDYAARLRRYMAQSLAGDLLPDEKPGEQFDPLALELGALQFQWNVPYRRLCEARGSSPENVSRWTDIPAVPASAFKELELTSLPEAERTRVFHSSGTTGQQPSRHFHDGDSLALYEASLIPWFQRHLLSEWGRAVGSGAGFQPAPRASSPRSNRGQEAHNVRLEACPTLDIDSGMADRRIDFLALTPPANEAPHSSLVHMFETVVAKFGSTRSTFCGKVATDGAWSLDPSGAESFLLDASAAGRPVAVMGTAFNFVHLLDGLAGRNRRLELPPGSRVLETGGYKGRSRALAKSELHALITERLGVPAGHIVCEYGMSELSSQAYDLALSPSCLAPRASRLFHFPPWTRVQIISPETGREIGEGETGSLRIFDLANIRSVLAIQTEDLAIRRGDGFELLGRAVASEARGCSLMAV
jgi:hypothetical protein